MTVDANYKVYLTPLLGPDEYGSEVDISDYVLSRVGNVSKKTDSDNYAIGAYLMGTVNLTCVNYNGEFNESDHRSFFPYKRDLSKIRIVYFNDTETTSFKGLITDKGTNINAEKELIKIRVLALESILDKTQVGAGIVEAGDLFSEAIKTILNVSMITSVLIYDESNISVDLDLAIDQEGGAFDDKSTWEALKLLLIASNSVVYIDDETIKVKTRDENTGEISYFYGPGDTLDRENIIKISEYNNGAHRIFNSVSINNTIYTDEPSKDWFGLSQTNSTLDFITDSDKELIIAKRLVNQFRYPRIEFKLTCTTKLANQINFFDTIAVSHPIRARQYRETDSPLWDVAEYDNDVYPIDFGGLIINGQLAFQIIERSENPGRFETTFKFRGRGKTFDDGTINAWISAYDVSLWDISTWGVGGQGASSSYDSSIYDTSIWS
jgi:hypothetical protein